MQEVTAFISHHPLLSLATLAVLLSLFIIETIRAKQGSFNVTPSQATQLINKQNAAVIDIRPQEAYRSGHIIGAQNFSSQDLQKNLKKLEKLKTKPLIIVAGGPADSQKTTSLLIKQGYNAFSLSGGIKAWQDADMPLIKE